MEEAPIWFWTGISGTEYRFAIYPLGTSFNELPGNYIFAKQAPNGSWETCYIGQAENMKERLSNHEKQACAIRHGATHIHAHVNFIGEQARCIEEKDLILRHEPPCNDLN
jgi:hypothetical protein